MGDVAFAVGGRCRCTRSGAHTEDLREAGVRQHDFVRLDAEEVADALQGMGRRAGGATKILVELRTVDAQLAADLRNRGVITARQAQVAAQIVQPRVVSVEG
ncbi:hypothetical protein SDC9_196599 [bioreactor metagenome]|uniref:Uncharacterized protein n=1 Tax=bioreactor metagenome TaxID=1076179 RepID=A0A645IDJ2_9ZZZZ